MKVESATCGVESVIITGDLDRRPSRAPDHEAENRALTRLAEAMGGDPAAVLQGLAETAMDLTRAESAGISLLEPGGEQGTFRWVATAGAWAPYRDGTMLRAESPCGEVIAREAVLLLDHPERAFPALLQADPGIGEALLAPFDVGGAPAGTLWVVKHDAEGRFEAEDARLLQSLARFAAAAHRMALALEAARVSGRESDTRHRELFERMEQGFCVIERVDTAPGEPDDFRYLIANPAFERHTGLRDVVGRTIRELVPLAEPSIMALYGEVIRTGEHRRLEAHVAALDLWMEAEVFPTQTPGQAAVLFSNVSDRKQAQLALRRNAERQTFLLALSDTLRPLVDLAEIMGVTSALLGRHLGVGRCGYGELDETGELFTVHRDWTDGVMASHAGTLRVSDYGEAAMGAYRKGAVLVIDDTHADPRMDGHLDAYDALGGVRANIAVPLVKDGRWVASFYVQQMTPRRWTPEEQALVAEVAERTWAAVERARAEQAMRDSEARFRTVTEAIEDVFYMTDLDRGALLYLSPSFEQVWGLPPAELLRDLSGFARTIHPDDQAVVAAGLARQRLGKPASSEYRIIRPDGEIRWIHDRCFPVRGGGTRRSAGIASDITARKEVETALHDSEARFRQFSDASTSVLWIRDAETLRMLFASPAFDRIYGIPGPDRGGDGRLRTWARLIEPENRKAVLSNFRRVRAGKRVEHEFRIRHAVDGRLRWVHNTDFPLRDAAGAVRWIAGLGADITDAKEAADRQGVLVAELQHRTRNLIAVVRSLADRTLGTASSLEDFGTRFRPRLAALSRVQGLLSHLAAGARVTFKELLCAELDAHGAANGPAGRLTLEGPADVPLRSATVQTFALALHELATNAVKYGAFAAPDGHLSVRWRVEPALGDDLPRLHVEWLESGVVMPHVSAAPRGSSYGRELIERALPYQLRAETRYELGPDGVRCTIAVPISRSASHGAPGGE